jgi:adenylate kinase
MFDFKVIFIAGVHGVGKSHFCSEVKNSLGLPAFSASKLIKEIKQAPVDINKKVIDVIENQDYLITGLKNIKTTAKTIILDGHFCLFDDDGIIDISEKTFEEMPLKAIYVLYDNPENIYHRIKNRDNILLSVDIISEQQEREIKRAKFIASLIEAPFYKFHFCDIENAIKDIKNYI